MPQVLGGKQAIDFLLERNLLSANEIIDSFIKSSEENAKTMHKLKVLLETKLRGRSLYVICEHSWRELDLTIFDMSHIHKFTKYIVDYINNRCREYNERHSDYVLKAFVKLKRPGA